MSVVGVPAVGVAVVGVSVLGAAVLNAHAVSIDAALAKWAVDTPANRALGDNAWVWEGRILRY
jgi:hypothetical protein